MTAMTPEQIEKWEWGHYEAESDIGGCWECAATQDDGKHEDGCGIGKLAAALREALHLSKTNREYEKLDTLRRACKERDELKRDSRRLQRELDEANKHAALDVQEIDDLRQRAERAEAMYNEFAVYLCDKYGDENLPETGDYVDVFEWAIRAENKRLRGALEDFTLLRDGCWRNVEELESAIDSVLARAALAGEEV